MRSVISSEIPNADMEFACSFGKTISNEVFVADLAKMPHFIDGWSNWTGGKSVGIKFGLTFYFIQKHPSELKFVW